MIQLFFTVTFAFVTYKTKLQALTAVNLLNEWVVQNHKIRVSLRSDYDKEFLETISAESCSETEDNCLDKENGTSTIANKNGDLADASNGSTTTTKPVRERSQSLKRDDLRSTSQGNLHSLKRNNSLKTISMAQPTETANSLIATTERKRKVKKRTRYFSQQVNPDLSSYAKPVDGVANAKENVKKTFEKLKQQIVQLNEPSSGNRMQNKPNVVATSTFKKPQCFPFQMANASNSTGGNLVDPFSTHTANSTTHSNQFSVNSDSPLAKKSTNSFSIDKNPFKFSVNEANPFSKFRKVNKPKETAKRAGTRNTPKLDRFQINETAFGFNQNLFYIDRNPTETLTIDCTNETQTEQPSLIVLDATLPTEFGNTTLFTDEDIDERLNKSIEIITLD